MNHPFQPQPVPINWTVEAVPAEPENMVVIQAEHAAGVLVGFLNPRDAKALAALIEEKAAKAAGSLIVPTLHLPGASGPN